MKEQELRDLFKNQSDCYADTWKEEFDHMVEGEVIQAMTEDRFIEVQSLIDCFPVLNSWNKYEIGKTDTYPKEYDKYFICRKDGKIHWETWNGIGWAYNNDVIIYWAKIIKPTI